MNSKQKKLTSNLVFVLGITIIFVVGMANFKDVINKRESMLAMKEIGKRILDYRKEHGSLPSEPVLENLRANLPGESRMGELHYRAQWVSIDSPPGTILAYDKKTYRWLFVPSGYVVLLLNGDVTYISEHAFPEMLKRQQSNAEIKDLQQQLQKSAPPAVPLE